MKKKANRSILICASILFLSILCGVVVYFGVFEIPDYWLMDMANRYLELEREKDLPISIIAIDEKTVMKYGEYDTWSRQISADFVNKLNAQENKPVIIGIDLPYTKEKDTSGDNAFVEACRDGQNVCIGVKQNMEEKQDKEAKLPYESLLDVVQVGISDNFFDGPTNTVREFVTSYEKEEYRMDGFAIVLYKSYQQHLGKEIRPKYNAVNNMQFNYSRNSQEYEVYSFLDIMDGTVDISKFQNKIVIVGDNTKEATMKAPFSMGGKMHDIILQAHMVDAMLMQRVIGHLPKSAVACVYSILILVCNLYIYMRKKKRNFLLMAIVCYVHFHLWFIITDIFYLPLIPLWLFMLLSITMQLIIARLKEQQERLQIQKALEAYVEPGIVEKILQNENYEIQLGGKKKDIAVLFVDIRGFTSISEGLEPEAVVNILNEYLELIARAVMKNKGTLDKFIGDAAMAIYNAPDDLPNYTVQAVRTARDIIKDVVQLKEQSKEKYGVEVAFGIGIHCGTAIVGNIGCECRMDYTAIGDVVNTASRLEGKAKADQILVSKDVYEQIKDIVEASYVGSLSLKGKKKEIEAYEITKITEGM
ncbi:MAG: CHASE2 domain-containing protein [Lachnospiraceae bacterium]|nr:CHASE2 domain-containing protein [Lachnospiraceae bacterium]